MNKLCGRPFLLLCLFLMPMAALAQNPDPIGVMLLQTVTTNLNGSGIRVAQPEAGYNGATNWEVIPTNVDQPVSLFTYASAGGSTNFYPNALGAGSWHAWVVGLFFYGMPGGVATNIAHVDNYEANFFITNYVYTLHPAPAAVIVNQSYTYGPLSAADQQSVDSAFDDYSTSNRVLFISAACDASISLQVCAPGTAYNCVSVGAYGGDSSIGPTIDNGRCKPDITVPAQATSYSTPQVAGAAAVLLQAGTRGDGGTDTNAATDFRTVKALLLNGAIKPADWTNGTASPLDARYGAGVLNVFNAYEQLAGQKQTNLVSNSVSTGAAHPPTGATNTVGALSGWSFINLTSSFSRDAVAHYYFNVTNGSGNATFTATATLVWNRQQNQSSINNLQLFLYNAANSNLVAVCTSAVDNVQHLFVPVLPPGRYDLQVLKKGGAYVTPSETYALAFEFFSMSLNVADSGTNVVLQWPVYPTGFVLESTTNLISPILWSTNNPAPVVTNGQNYVVLSATNLNQYFQLQCP